ncbi:hypothetical protein TWF281_009810 [Arthrobotrys megalospora]
MGASQSTQDPNTNTTAGDSSSGSSAMKQDFYTLLGVDSNADQDEIKKAYRKKALELHPDKNVNNVEAATKLFSEVQAAYEVLSDPQERAWYDSHKDQILREDTDLTGDGTVSSSRPENVTLTAPELLQKFSLFSSRMDTSDSNPKGFFSTASQIFETLAREEESAASKLELDIPYYPSFGNSKSDYQDSVRVFYTVWTGFSTLKTFSWEDKYRYKDAPDRRVKRLMEKENKKFRETAIREFNDTVKQFVLYIRKRDPRYLPNFQTDKERDAASREASKDQSRRARLENAAKLASYKEADWSKTKEVVYDDETDEEDEEDEEPAVEFECVACNKTFKTEKQLEMHEKSKKHIKMVQSIKRQMRKDGVALHLDDDGDDGGSDNVDEGVQKPKSKKSKAKKNTKYFDEEEDDDDIVEYLDDDDEDEDLSEGLPAKSTEKSKQPPSKKTTAEDDDDDEEEDDEEDEESDESLAKDAQKLRVSEAQEPADNNDDDNADDDKETSNASDNNNDPKPSQQKSKTKKARRRAKQQSKPDHPQEVSYT